MSTATSPSLVPDDLGTKLFKSSTGMLLLGLITAVFTALCAPSWYTHTVNSEWHWIDLTALGIKHLSLHWVVVDILMAFVFFFLVGLHLKEDFSDKNHGSFKNARDAISPLFAACGGVAVPVLLCWAVMVWMPGEAQPRALGIPMATDIAFTLAVASMLGLTKRETSFLMALAIFDDIFGIVIIGLFYGDASNITATMKWLKTDYPVFASMPQLFPLLGLALGSLFTLVIGFLLKVQSKYVYLLALPGLWYVLHELGVHPTLSGVFVGLAVPHNWQKPEKSLAVRMKNMFAPFEPIVLFLFAFVSCGITMASLQAALADPTMAWAVGSGLFIGKPVGVFLATMLLWKLFPSLRMFSLGRVWLTGALSGIGFTVALFVNGLAFDAGTTMLSAAMLGIIVASVASVIHAAIAAAIFRTKEKAYDDTAEAMA